MSLLLDTTFNKASTQYLAALKAQWDKQDGSCKNQEHDECKNCSTVEKCGICLERFQGNVKENLMVEPSTSHTFHGTCLEGYYNTWAQNHQIQILRGTASFPCPLCRNNSQKIATRSSRIRNFFKFSFQWFNTPTPEDISETQGPNPSRPYSTDIGLFTAFSTATPLLLSFSNVGAIEFGLVPLASGVGQVSGLLISKISELVMKYFHVRNLDCSENIASTITLLFWLKYLAKGVRDKDIVSISKAGAIAASGLRSHHYNKNAVSLIVTLLCASYLGKYAAVRARASLVPR